MKLERILTKQIAEDHIYKITLIELHEQVIKDIKLTGKNKQEWLWVLVEKLRGCPTHIIQAKINDLISIKSLIPLTSDPAVTTMHTKYYLNPKLIPDSMYFHLGNSKTTSPKL